MSRFRPVKVLVQVVGVIEDDEGNLTETPTNPVSVPFAQWAEFAAEGGGMTRALNALQAQVAGPPKVDEAQPEHNGRVTKRAPKVSP